MDVSSGELQLNSTLENVYPYYGDGPNWNKSFLSWMLENATEHQGNGVTQEGGSARNEEAAEHLERLIMGQLWTILPPILIVLGIGGNCIILLIMSHRPFRGSSTACYLCGLAISDIVILLSGLLRYWIDQIADTDVRDLSVISCKLHTFVTVVALDLSVWLLAAVSVERCISVAWPIQVGRVCTLRSSQFVMMALVAFAIALNCHFFATRDLLPDTSEQPEVESSTLPPFTVGVHIVQDSSAAPLGQLPTLECRYIKSFSFVKNYVLPWVVFVVYSVVPFAVISICNGYIIRVLVRRTKAVTLTSGRSVPVVSTSYSVTIMMLTVSVVFLISCFPTIIRKIIEPYVDTASRSYRFTFKVVKLLQYLPPAVNFYLYCISGQRFRTAISTHWRRLSGKDKQTSTFAGLQSTMGPGQGHVGTSADGPTRCGSPSRTTHHRPSRQQIQHSIPLSLVANYEANESLVRANNSTTNKHLQVSASQQQSLSAVEENSKSEFHPESETFGMLPFK